MLQCCIPGPGEGGNFLISSSRFAAGPELGVCSVGGGRELVLESGSPVTVTYFPAGVNSLLAGRVPPLHGNCREQPALRHLSWQEALESQSACQVSNPGLCAAKGAQAQGQDRAGQGMRVQLAVRGCARTRTWNSASSLCPETLGTCRGCGVGGCLSVESRKTLSLGPRVVGVTGRGFGVLGVTRKGYHSDAVWCAVMLWWMLSLWQDSV